MTCLPGSPLETVHAWVLTSSHRTREGARQLRAQLALAIATGPDSRPVSGIALHDEGGHVALARNTARSRTSLPVVVRGN